jgi:hypothetical protein
VLDRYKMPGGPERDVTTAYAQQIFAGQAPIYEDERLTVYQVVEPAERGPYLILTPGWSPRHSDEAGHVWRALPADQPARLEIVNPGGGPLALTIATAAPAGGRLLLQDAAGRELGSWELSPELATVHSGSFNASTGATLRLIYEGEASQGAAIHSVALAQAQ